MTMHYSITARASAPSVSSRPPTHDPNRLRRLCIVLTNLQTIEYDTGIPHDCGHKTSPGHFIHCSAVPPPLTSPLEPLPLKALQKWVLQLSKGTLCLIKWNEFTVFPRPAWRKVHKTVYRDNAPTAYRPAGFSSSAPRSILVVTN